MVCISVPDSEKAMYYKAKGKHTWKEFLETGLFGDRKPSNLVSIDEMEAFVNQKLSELKEEMKK